MLKKIILLLLVTSSIAIGQQNRYFSDSVRVNNLEKRIVDVEFKNKILEEKNNIITTTNDRIFTAFYTLIGILLTAVIAAGIWNAIQNWKLNTKELNNIKESLNTNLGKATTDLEKTLIEKINKDSNLTKINLDILKLDFKFQQHLVTTYDFYGASPDINIEYSLLCRLLGLSIKIQKESYEYIDEIGPVLKAINSYLEKHPNPLPSEIEDFYDAIKKVPDSKYDLYLDKIKAQLKIV